MTTKELKRKTLLDKVLGGQLSLKDASLYMEVSYRQAKRILTRYRQEQDKGLLHRNRGKQPSNAYSKEFKEKILTIYCKKYTGFGPTFASEKFEEDDGLIVKPETLRLWLKKEGLWIRKRKYKIYRERRERRSCFGDLLQIDGSIHYWFADRSRHDCLLNVVDDATGITMAMLATGETTEVLLKVIKKWITTYGIPKAVYVDLKNVYVSSKQWMNKYDEDVPEGFSVFQRVCQTLGIEVIRAYSAQAKGRVERKHAVFQDRLVKEIKLYELKTIEEVNVYLEKKFLNKINQKFAKSPRELSDSHRPYIEALDLDEILCWQYIRKLRNDWTIRFKNEFYQIKKTALASLQPGQEITIKKYLDKHLKFWYQGQELGYATLDGKPEAPSKSKKYSESKGRDPVLQSKIATKNKHKTPWSQFNPGWLKTGS